MSNEIGPEGAKRIAEGIAVSASLTSIDIRDNRIGEEMKVAFSNWQRDDISFKGAA